MLGKTKTISLLVQVAVLATLLTFVLARPLSQLPTIPEVNRVRFADSAPAQQQLVPAPAQPLAPGPGQQGMRIPTGAVVRGQGSRLIPVSSPPLKIIPMNPAPFHPVPDLAFHNPASAAAPQLGERLRVVKLQGNHLDWQILQEAKKEGKPFYAIEADGKMRLYNSRDGTWTYRIPVQDARAVQDYVQGKLMYPKQAAPKLTRVDAFKFGEGGAMSPMMNGGARVAEQALSPTLTRSTATTANRFKPTWFSQLGDGVKSIFGKSTGAGRVLHSF